jgi:hypothetical protein
MVVALLNRGLRQLGGGGVVRASLHHLRSERNVVDNTVVVIVPVCIRVFSNYGCYGKIN